MNKHPLAKGNFCDEHKNALQPAIVQEYDTLAPSAGRPISRWGRKKLFPPTVFHLLDLITLNSCILISCGSKLSHRNFRLSLVRNLKEEDGRVIGTQNSPQGTPNLSISQLEARDVLHWLEIRDAVEVSCVLCCVSRCHMHSKFLHQLHNGKK
jgi:hypothetical protein